MWELCLEGGMLRLQHTLPSDICGGAERGLLTAAFSHSLSSCPFPSSLLILHRQDSPQMTSYNTLLEGAGQLLCPRAAAPPWTLTQRCWLPLWGLKHRAPKCSGRHPHSSHSRGHGDQDRHMSGIPGSVHMHMYVCTLQEVM